MAAFFVGMDARIRACEKIGKKAVAGPNSGLDRHSRVCRDLSNSLFRKEKWIRAIAGMTPGKVRGCSFTVRAMSKNANLVVPALVSAPKAKTSAGFKFTGVGMALQAGILPPAVTLARNSHRLHRSVTGGR
jgi:hypothetical protein